MVGGWWSVFGAGCWVVGGRWCAVAGWWLVCGRWVVGWWFGGWWLVVGGWWVVGCGLRVVGKLTGCLLLVAAGLCVCGSVFESARWVVVRVRERSGGSKLVAGA